MDYRGLKRIISGGQTGVDRAAIDAARNRILYSWGGWVPKGRTAEDGKIPDEYFSAEDLQCGFKEHENSRDYKSRTLKNIDASDATLILCFRGAGQTIGPGTKLTISTLRKKGKPYRIFDPSKIYTVPKAAQWICEATVKRGNNEKKIEILNVAGSRESKSPGIYEKARIYLYDVLGYVSIYQTMGVRIWAPKTKIRINKQK